MNPDGPATKNSLAWGQAMVLVVLYSMPAVMCLRAFNIADPDVWWHLRAAEWIMQHGAVPHQDSFNSFAMGKPWAAYSWLFELMLWPLFQRLGLQGIAVFTVTLVVAIAVATHRLVRCLQADFTLAVLLTGLACFCMQRLWTPRPWLFSILFFAIEIDLILEARKTGRVRGLLWLPVIFALWANLHIQFIDGLVVLAIALAESLAARSSKSVEERLNPMRMGGIFIACLLATLANPYGWGIYKAAYELASQKGVLDNLPELHAMTFRHLGDWAVLALTLGATAILARLRRWALFETLAMAFAVYVTFKSQRDLWVLVLVAGPILAAGLVGDAANRYVVKKTAWPMMAALVALVIFLTFRLRHMDQAHLETRLQAKMPVNAVRFIQSKGYNGPLFNDFDWGGYLIWSLRMPVSIDGRAALMGDELIDRAIDTWNALPGWQANPDLQKANLVIGQIDMPLNQVLRLDPHFQLVYEDKTAVVFVRVRQ